MVKIGKRARFAIASREGRRDVDGWLLVGADGLAIHRDGVPGWVVTHVASGMRLPREFRTRADAVAAVGVLLELCPDALEIMGRIVARFPMRDGIRRIREAWIVASSGDARATAYARIRADIARQFGGSWDAAATRVLADLGEAADGWTYSGDVLSCPCGHTVEDDGRCPHGHVSPFRAAGLV
jgi:hypothetical protein